MITLLIIASSQLIHLLIHLQILWKKILRESGFSIFGGKFYVASLKLVFWPPFCNRIHSKAILQNLRRQKFICTDKSLVNMSMMRGRVLQRTWSVPNYFSKCRNLKTKKGYLCIKSSTEPDCVIINKKQTNKQSNKTFGRQVTSVGVSPQHCFRRIGLIFIFLYEILNNTHIT